MELKFEKGLRYCQGEKGLNRTFMELKLSNQVIRPKDRTGLNRTFMELKFYSSASFGGSKSV